MRILVFIAALLLLGGCRGENEPVRVSEADSGSRIVLRSGQTLEVVLASNPTTGYRWQLSLADDAPLQSQGPARYEQSPSPAGMVGVGGTETWTLRGVRAGSADLRFEYRRPFEPDLPAGQTAEFAVSVR